MSRIIYDFETILTFRNMQSIHCLVFEQLHMSFLTAKKWQSFTVDLEL